jgi:uncharacterized protein (TIGR03435 family)
MAEPMFDIQAKISTGASRDQIPSMLLALLRERFKLEAHREAKEVQVYVLRQASGGHRLIEALPDEDLKDGNPGQARHVTPLGAKVSEGMRIEFERQTMAELARYISPMVDHPVVDKTGLTGRYRFALELTLQEVMHGMQAAGNDANISFPSVPEGGASDPSGGAIFPSIQRLGLRLDKGSASVTTIVVDRCEREPTEN